MLHCALCESIYGGGYYVDCRMVASSGVRNISNNSKSCDRLHKYSVYWVKNSLEKIQQRDAQFVEIDNLTR